MTAITASGRAGGDHLGELVQIRRPASSDRSTRITAPISPRSIDTRTRDFSGTKPRTAGSAAIRAPGRFRAKVAMRVCVMADDGRNRHRHAGPATARTRPRLWMNCGNCEMAAEMFTVAVDTLGMRDSLKPA